MTDNNMTEDYEEAEDEESLPGLTYPSFGRQRCRVCGCTDRDCRKCIEKTGKPCYWVEKDLCSACIHVTLKPA